VTARTYDSGLAGPIRTLVRNAVVAKLAPLGVAHSGFLEAIVPIGFEVRGHDDHSIDLLWNELNGKIPAVGVAALGMAFHASGAPDRSRAELAVEVYVVSSHRRGVTEGRTSSDAAAADLTQDPGIDVTLELIWQLLFNADLGIGARANPMKLTREVEIIADNDRTIWAQHWECLVTRDVNKNRDVTQLLTQMVSTLSQSRLDPDPVPLIVESDS